MGTLIRRLSLSLSELGYGNFSPFHLYVFFFFFKYASYRPTTILITAHTIYYVRSKLFWAAAGSDNTNAHTYINMCICVSGRRKILRLHVPTTNYETDLCSAASIKGYPNKHLLTKMRKTGRAFGPMPRMIITGRILVLGELRVMFTESSHIYFNVTSTFNQTGPFFPCHFNRRKKKPFKPFIFFFFIIFFFFFF